jgi:hypothetical protein
MKSKSLSMKIQIFEYVFLLEFKLSREFEDSLKLSRGSDTSTTSTTARTKAKPEPWTPGVIWASFDRLAALADGQF